jgi:hypothetical protein
VLSTAEPDLEPGERAYRTREEVRLPERSLVVLRRLTGSAAALRAGSASAARLA